MSTEAAQNGYGTLSYINSVQLIVSFSLVAIFAVVSDEGLNRLEAWAHGAGFQELFQRIYRELMIMGIASFGINILSASSGGELGSWEFAYYFSDNIIFLISAFFCLQGIGVMAVSLIEAKSWDRSSKISTEELLLDVENEIRQNTFSWRTMWYPFNITRNQLEFRVFKLLFSKQYKIGGGNDEFNFGYFLRLSHQHNVISSIDMTPPKWLTVVILVGLISLYYSLNIAQCKSKHCENSISVYVFAGFGFLIFLLACILYTFGRIYELKLLSLVGLTSVSDYDIYLQTEAKIKQKVANSLVDNHMVTDVLAQLEVEHSIREAAQRNLQAMERPSLRQRLELIAVSLGLMTQVHASYVEEQSRMAAFEKSTSMKPKHLRSERVVPVRSDDIEMSSVTSIGGNFADRVISLHNSIKYDDIGEEDVGKNEKKKNDNHGNKVEAREKVDVKPTHPHLKNVNDSSLNRNSTGHQHPPRLDVVSAGSPGVDVTESCTADSWVQNIPETLQQDKSTDGVVRGAWSSVNSLLTSPGRKKSIFDVVVERRLIESVIVNMKGSQHHHRRASLQSESSHKAPAVDDDRFDQHKQFYRRELLRGKDYLKHFRSLFFRCRPELFFNCVHFIMLCNTLYLAWWITTTVFYLSNLGTRGHAVTFAFVSLLPPVLTFPLLTLLVRQTTVFKTLMRLDAGVVTSALNKAQTLNAALKALQQNLKIRLIGITEQGETLSKSHVNDLFDDINVSGTMYITMDEFHLMLSKMNIHLPRATVYEVFKSVDMNNDDFLNMDEFERFVFPDECAEEDKKKAKFFDAKNTKDIAMKGKQALSDQMFQKATDGLLR